MMTVKELSNLTGISVRALHYYDEIGLLSPTQKSEAGYRLYDDRALEHLQQILFFREFDIPLKEIKAVMESPALDKNHILQVQRQMLVAKGERIRRLVASIDDILKGENKMDFEVFNKSEILGLCQTSIDRMPDFLRQSIEDEFGGMEQWKEHYVKRASKQDMQKGYQKLVEWYGDDKEFALKAITRQPSMEAINALKNRVDAILGKLYSMKNQPVHSHAVKEAVGEYGFVMKQFYQMKHEKGLMLSIASSYSDERMKATLDQQHGEGAAAFFAQAMNAFYGNRRLK